MTAWRVIITDSESMTGVAPVCEDPSHDPARHDDDPDGTHVFNCCPGPHIETYDELSASIVAATLTANDARLCS